MSRAIATIDGNEAVASVAHRLNEVIAIYPITPSSPMGEWADQWASEGQPNIWGTVPSVVEMQSEGGAVGAVHGALQTGALTTTFTASQGLLLMIPNMYKIAGELTATVFNDDVSHTSIDYDPTFSIEPDSVVRALFYGLGSDGTVGANKNSIKIIAEDTNLYAQGYFVYDSKKAGAVTVSHLRFGPEPIRSTYLVTRANFVGCHQWVFLERYDMLENIVPGGTFLLHSAYGPDAVWDRLPRLVQQQIIEKHLKLYVIDAYKVAKDSGMGGRINTVMQVCFFAISGVLPNDERAHYISSLQSYKPE